MFSPKAFAILTKVWLTVGWSLKYYHRFTWLGFPVLQLPEDLIRFQEAVLKIKPDVIIETGVFAGGSLAYSASLCQLQGRGRIVGIDIDVRAEIPGLLNAHPWASHITVIEGDSTDSLILAKVMRLINSGDVVMVVLDSNHSAAHVAKELEMYAPLVSVNSCIVVADAVMKDLATVPGGQQDWAFDNPGTAIDMFSENHPEFERRSETLIFDESLVDRGPTYWPEGWLWRRINDIN